jgi:Mg-chelatase subunit ChlD
MRARSPLALALPIACIAAGVLSAAAASAAAPAIARARYQGRDAVTSGTSNGTVFFLQTAAGPVAVGAAHNFERDRLAAVPEVVFELGRTRKRVAAATRVLVEPGLAFSAPGGSLRTDLVVFALDVPPAARTLAAGAQPKVGDRVKLLGIPNSSPRDEDDIYATVRRSDAQRLEVELDVFYDLRGWGGAPVVSKEYGSALGIVQGAVPTGKTLLVSATPIGVVIEALASPLEGGRGRAFAALASPGAAPSRAGGSGAGPAAREAAPARPLARQTVETRPLTVEIEQPLDGAVFGDELGAFLAGRALAPLGDVQRLDVVFVIDTSGSTSAPSGMDVNGNGVVGTSQLGAVGSALGLGSTDSGDTILAAEVAAAQQFLARLDARRTRVSLVTFAGEDLGHGSFEVISPDSAITEVGLTGQYAEVQRALNRVLKRGPRGLTHMAAGVDQALIELLGLKGAFSEPDPKSDKIVVFLTDGQPVMPRAGPEEAVLRAAQRARKAGVRFFTYGIGEEALAGPLAIVQLAETTGGTFTPVREAGRLPELIAEAQFADIAQLTVRNVTLKEPAHVAELGPDGSFGAMLPLAPGRNELEVVATASDGRTASDKVTVQYAPGAPPPAVPPALVASRNRLLELRLAQIKRVRLEVEEQQAEQLREELRVEIERERAAAAERAEKQRKELELKVEKEAGTGGDPGAKQP